MSGACRPLSFSGRCTVWASLTPLPSYRLASLFRRPLRRVTTAPCPVSCSCWQAARAANPAKAVPPHIPATTPSRSVVAQHSFLLTMSSARQTESGSREPAANATFAIISLRPPSPLGVQSLAPSARRRGSSSKPLTMAFSKKSSSSSPSAPTSTPEMW